MRVEIPIEILELEADSYHILVYCEIDKTKALFVIDTGASKTVLDSNFENINIQSVLSSSESETAGIGGNAFDVELVQISDFSINEFYLETLNVALIDLSGVNKMYNKHCDISISGLLGSDFLLKNNACIDYFKKVLILENK